MRNLSIINYNECTRHKGFNYHSCPFCYLDRVSNINVDVSINKEFYECPKCNLKFKRWESFMDHYYSDDSICKNRQIKILNNEN